MKNFYRRSLTVIVFLILLAALVILSMSQAKAVTAKFYKSAFQQEVSGQVTGQNGEPLLGVTVLVKNRQYGTTTNKEGIYRVKATPSDTLVFTSIGFKKLEVPLQGRTNLDVQLQEDIASLGEVEINAGYYNVTERERTGNISRVTAEEIENQPVISPLQALQGRVAGLEVVEPNGIPGVAPTIRIRGQNSLRSSINNNGNLPLYIIDGMPINSAPLTSINQFVSAVGTDPLNGLNLSNIQSIEILKDADATAIYGSRGANGVILITTKNGKFTSDKDRVEARVYSGVSRVSHFVDLLDTPQYLALRRQAFENDGVEPTEANAKDLLLWDQNRNTDWQKVLFGNSAPTFSADLNYLGGGDNTSFRIGASYFKQGSVFPGDNSFEKKTTNFSLNHRSQNEKFQLNFSANYGINESDLFSASNFVSAGLRLPPNAPKLYQEDGSLNWENSTWVNPLAPLQSKGKTKSDNLVTNLHLEYELVDGLTFKTNLGYTFLNSRQDILLPKEIYNPTVWAYVSDRSQHSFINRKSWIAEPQLVYEKTLREHNLDLLVGTTIQRNENAEYTLNATGFANGHLIGNLEAADAVSVTKDQHQVYKYQAIFARFGYNFKKTYFLNLTGRRDGSSRFGPKKRIANFGAIGAAWIFTNSQFLKNDVPFLSFGKIRGSYGITGNDQIGDYRYLDTYQSTPGPGGLYPTRLTNPVFSWETNRKIEVALELGFLEDKINLNLSWYRNRSSNQLVGYNLPAITGFNSVEANLPATVQNKGFEIEFTSLNVQNKIFTWRSSLNLSIPSNKLVRFDGLEESTYANAYRVGEPLDLVTLYQFDGIDAETGFLKVVDVNGDGRYDFDDRIIPKNTGREYFGGISNSFTYHNFSFDFLVEFVRQNGLRYYNNVPGYFGNVNRQSIEDSPLSQRPTQSITGYLAFNNAAGSEIRIMDASYARLKTLNLGYRLPKAWLDNTPLSSLQFFLHGQNLLTLTKFDGLDPQNPGSLTVPSLQSITGGIQINF
ncbi:SusC/RagA family TonB-linked outer membrane protein [Christiangramia fulva]|uniref:SusC/RagA family TonB-linked outer membrane protein n=1 Tax=Christiangramia fulva TaxID=2126553 RepID=A0A2R3ZAC2_9FLAO|nr:SusC/RagA family TonB-linked outer membrane protein [Christiangramia fulva]AVR47201.1 SusC/RagA family TonB-linked outer membrane protein [Christiangramia fulva]